MKFKPLKKPLWFLALALIAKGSFAQVVHVTNILERLYRLPPFNGGHFSDHTFSGADFTDNGLIAGEHGYHDGITRHETSLVYDTQTEQYSIIYSGPGTSRVIDINRIGQGVGSISYSGAAWPTQTFFYRSFNSRYYPLALPAPALPSPLNAVYPFVAALNDHAWKVGSVSGMIDGSDIVRRDFAVLWTPDTNGITSTAQILPCNGSAHANIVTNDGMIGGDCSGRASIWYWGIQYPLWDGLFPENIGYMDPNDPKRARILTVSRSEYLSNPRIGCTVVKITEDAKFAVNCSESGVAEVAFVSPTLSSFPLLQLRQDGAYSSIKALDINNNGSVLFSFTDHRNVGAFDIADQDIYYRVNNGFGRLGILNLSDEELLRADGSRRRLDAIPFLPAKLNDNEVIMVSSTDAGWTSLIYFP